MRTFKIYHVGISKALEHYRAHNAGKLPVAVVVNLRSVAETIAVIGTLGLDLPVAGNGGALLGEVWLE